MDRDPNAILNRLHDLFRLGKTKEAKDGMIRTVVCGDAVHAMSPFKGQGCNQESPYTCKQMCFFLFNAANKFVLCHRNFSNRLSWTGFCLLSGFPGVS